eukprot:8803388-Lingulodinium_polyedra.AAC.1
MAAPGLGADFEEWGPTKAAPERWRPLERPRSDTLWALKAARAERQWRAVAGRRLDMTHLADG